MLVDFKSLPKVELHLHFDCSLSYAALISLKSLDYLKGFFYVWKGIGRSKT